MRTVQTSFDFHLRSPQTRAHFFAWHAPAGSVPADGVIVRHLAGHDSVLIADIPATDIAKPGLAKITVLNPTSSGVISNVFKYQITWPTSR